MDLNFNDQQIDDMLNKASANLGIDKDSLKHKLMNNDLEGLFGSNQSPQKMKILQLMQQPGMLEKFLRSDMAKELLKKYNKEN